MFMLRVLDLPHVVQVLESLESRKVLTKVCLCSLLMVIALNTEHVSQMEGLNTVCFEAVLRIYRVYMLDLVYQFRSHFCWSLQGYHLVWKSWQARNLEMSWNLKMVRDNAKNE